MTKTTYISGLFLIPYLLSFFGGAFPGRKRRKGAGLERHLIEMISENFPFILHTFFFSVSYSILFLNLGKIYK
jgi:hypothetical protein